MEVNYMGIALSTAGVTVGYATESTVGTRPTTGYKIIPDIKEIPEMNPEPETLETTTLAATEYKTYIEGLKDLGGALSFLANYTTELETEWSALVTAYTTAKTSGKSIWFEVKHPQLTKSVFFTGQPSAMGLPGMSVNSVLETNLYITPTNAPVWETKSTTGTT
jgi:hypothetical protein